MYYFGEKEPLSKMEKPRFMRFRRLPMTCLDKNSMNFIVAEAVSHEPVITEADEELYHARVLDSTSPSHTAFVEMLEKMPQLISIPLRPLTLWQ